jgi:hypothetical protein
MPKERSPSAARPAHVKSAVSTGRRLFVDGDGRSPWARRYRDLIELHADDLGGLSSLSEAQHSIVKRISSLTCEIEAMEGRMSSSTSVNLDVYVRSVGLLRRLLETIGLERKARDVTPSLSDYVKGRAA